MRGQKRGVKLRDEKEGVWKLNVTCKRYRFVAELWQNLQQVLNEFERAYDRMSLKINV